MNKSVKKNVIVSAILSIALCVSLVAGATFALFTSESKVNIAVTSGKVKVVASVSDFEAYSPAGIAVDGSAVTDATNVANNSDSVKVFANGGTATLEENAAANSSFIKLENVTPGDKVTFTVTVKNYSNVKVQYRTVMKDATALADGETSLFGALSFTVGGMSDVTESDWEVLAPAGDSEAGVEVATYACSIELPVDALNEYQGLSCEIAYIVEAVQGNAKTSTLNKTVKVPAAGDEAKVITDALTEAKETEGVTTVNLAIPEGATVSLANDVMNNNSTSLKKVVFSGELGENPSTVDVITDSVSGEGGKLNYQRGTSFVFKNLEIKAGEGSFDGIVCDDLVFENCVITGKLTLYGNAEFVDCTFDNTMENQYSIWTWGGKKVTLDNCVFNTNGKAILLYGQATAANPTDLVVKDCVFNDRNNGSAEKAAIEVGNDYNATYKLTVNNITVNGFAPGKVTGSKIWANKNSMDDAHLTVTIDGVRQVGTLEAALGVADGMFGAATAVTDDVVIDGENKVAVYKWVDAYVNSNTTIKNISFLNGATINVKANNVKLNIENCTFYACDQSLLVYKHSNSTTNSGAGMCLDIEQKLGISALEAAVKNCTFVGENNPELPVYGNKYNADGSVADAYKKRGHAIALNAISGGGDEGVLKTLLIENCEIDGVRGNAIQLYGKSGNITIKDTKINSWGVNNGAYVDGTGATKNADSAAIRGDFVVGGARTLTITNVYFGRDEGGEEGHKLSHVNVGKYSGNTDGSRKARTY